MGRFVAGGRLFLLLLFFMFGSIQTLHANLITNPGFETSESTSDGWPATYGDWSGDDSAIVDSQNGITPHGGNQMLHFIYAAFEPSGTKGSDVVQLVDMNSWSDDIDAGLVYASASAWFNRVVGDSQTDTEFVLFIYAYDGSASGYPHTSTLLDKTSVQLFTDADTGTWQMAGIDDWLLPFGTDYLAVKIQAVENIYNDTSGTEFDGHYADDVTLTLTTVPIPGALWLLGSGLFGLVAVRRKHNNMS